MVSFAAAALIPLFTLGIYYYLLKKRNKFVHILPPGPRGLPFFGSIFSLSSRAYVRMGEWVKYYGPIFHLRLFHYKIVVISDAQLAREAFNNPALAGKPDFRLFNALSEGNHGIINSWGKEWVELRRFTIRQLRNFGFGKETQLKYVMEEVHDVIDWFKTTAGKPTLIDATFDLPTVNSLWSIVTGTRFSKDDTALNEFLSKSNEAFDKIALNPLAIFFPDFCDKFPTLTGWNDIQYNIDGFKKFITEPVVKLKEGYSPEHGMPHDFVEACIQKISKTTDPESPFYKSTGEKNTSVLAFDLFDAGSVTTSQVLSFSLLYLCKYLEIQGKLQAEIDRVVGRSRHPILEDRKDMPYTVAFMQEALRKSSFMPFGKFHEATDTTTLVGYTIPKGTWVAVNQHFIHHDPKVWGDPENFRPERFLSSDGKTVVKNDALIPFSVGKRVCIGEQIAKDTFFLFLTAIMQRFSIKFDPDS